MGLGGGGLTPLKYGPVHRVKRYGAGLFHSSPEIRSSFRLSTAVSTAEVTGGGGKWRRKIGKLSYFLRNYRKFVELARFSGQIEI